MKNLFKILILSLFLFSILLSNNDFESDQTRYNNYTIEDFDNLLKIENILKEIEKHDNGQIKRINFYKTRQPWGGRDYLKSFHYYDNGLIKEEMVYNLNGYGGCSLKSYEYYENGVLKSYSYNEPRYEDNFIHCELNGMGYLYHENGIVRRETMWKDHTLIWEKYYSKEGILENEINQEGKWIYYNKDGSIREGY